MTKSKRKMTTKAETVSNDTARVPNATVSLGHEQYPADDQPSPGVNPEEIRMLAYYKWEASDCPEGDGLEFWLEAEQEITSGQADSIAIDETDSLNG